MYIVLKWRNIYIERLLVSLMASLKMEGIFKCEGVGGLITRATVTILQTILSMNIIAPVYEYATGQYRISPTSQLTLYIKWSLHLKTPRQPAKYGLKLEMVLKWKDSYNEIVWMVSIDGLKMEGIIKWRGL